MLFGALRSLKTVLFSYFSPIFKDTMVLSFHGWLKDPQFSLKNYFQQWYLRQNFMQLCSRKYDVPFLICAVLCLQLRIHAQTTRVVMVVHAKHWKPVCIDVTVAYCTLDSIVRRVR